MGGGGTGCRRGVDAAIETRLILWGAEIPVDLGSRIRGRWRTTGGNDNGQYGGWADYGKEAAPVAVGISGGPLNRIGQTYHCRPL
jgi:hypothetical protein